MPDKKPAVVKKVKAFPINATFTVGTQAIPAKIAKLTPLGFLAETQAAFLKAGDKFTVAFEIPVLHVNVTEACVIVKHYSHWIEKEGGKVPGFLIEAHFQQLSEGVGGKIVDFLSALRSKP
ncbi:MAG: hypothetical protein EOP05_06835 [Proteobacteria bacterium]|nr:MAG: hypothetical protein EOP05_06835 [Pseudomonadota bacterium]